VDLAVLAVPVVLAALVVLAVLEARVVPVDLVVLVRLLPVDLVVLRQSPKYCFRPRPIPVWGEFYLFLILFSLLQGAGL
jgi:hypothetical protein